MLLSSALRAAFIACLLLPPALPTLFNPLSSAPSRHAAITKWISCCVQTVEKFPQLTDRDIKFCAVLHEAQHNDARTNLAIALSAAEHGADITNYTSVIDFIKDESGTVKGASVRDDISGRTFDVTAKSIIIAGVLIEYSRRLLTDLSALSRVVIW